MLQRTEEPLSRSRRFLLGNSHGVLATSTMEEALTALETATPRASSSPPSFVVDTIASILHKCRKGKNSSYATRLHVCMRENGLESHRTLGNQLVSLLVDVGSIHDAQQVFNKLRYRSECAWTSLISGYIKNGKPQLALTLYGKMQEDSVQPSGYTFVALLKACLKLKDVERGHCIHFNISKRGLERDLFVGSALVD
eukprot:c16053_g1_i1 orf=80-670(+)